MTTVFAILSGDVAMTMHQCPKCELRFAWQTELDDHCRADHPEFHHDYPVRGVRQYAEPAEPRRTVPTPTGG